MSTTSTLESMGTTLHPALTKIPMTRQQFEALGETRHHEYYGGMCVVNPPRRNHVRASRRLTRLLDDACPPDHEVLAEWGWKTADSIFEPDIMIVPLDAPADILRQPPLLIVEILSPSNRLDDLVTKRAKYEAAGAPWYWIVDLDEPTLIVLRNDDGVFVEVQRITRPAITVGPLSIEVDPALL